MLGFEGSRAVVSVSGELDLATAPTLGGLLESLVGHGHTDVVLDLHALEFFDATGVRVLYEVLSLLQPIGGRLSLRSVPRHTQRVLEVTGFADLVDTVPALRTSESDPARVRAHQTVAQHAVRPRLGPLERNNEPIDVALRLVVVLTEAAVRGAHGASVTLYRHGRLITLAASDVIAEVMDRAQFETGQGPCLSAVAEGGIVRVDALADEARWPNFVPRAVERGIASVISSPLATGDGTIGALNIYSFSEGAFGRDELAVAAFFTTHVTQMLTDAGLDVPEHKWMTRLRAAMLSRKLIAQAQGMLMERYHLSADQAAAKLAQSSRSAGLTLLDSAVDVTRTSIDGETTSTVALESRG